ITVVGQAVEAAPVLTLPPAAPLLEEERDLRDAALVAYRHDPLRRDRPRTRAALAADDHPVDTGQVKAAEILQQRFDGQKPHRRAGGVTQVIDARQPVLAVLDADAPPDVAKVR